MIILPVTDKDRSSLVGILENGIYKVPDIKISIYKNRGGSVTGVYLWCTSDLGTCRIDPMFVTDYSYNIKQIREIDISVKGSAF